MELDGIQKSYHEQVNVGKLHIIRFVDFFFHNLDSAACWLF